TLSPLDLHSFPTRRSSDLAGIGMAQHPALRQHRSKIVEREHRVNAAQRARSTAVNVSDRGVWMRTAHESGVQQRWNCDVIDEARSEEHTSELQSRGHLVCR